MLRHLVTTAHRYKRQSKSFPGGIIDMVISNHKRIGLALELLKMGVAPYIEREIKTGMKRGYISGHLIHDYVEDPKLLKTEIGQWEIAPLLKLMDDSWNVLFQNTLGFSENSVLGELRDWLLKWDHQTTIDNDDTDRILDSVVRFLNAINATDVATDAENMKKEFRKIIYEEQMRSEKQSEESEALEDEDNPEEAEKDDLVKTEVSETLKSWREVVTPLPDIIGGRYLETEFAADLWQVHMGKAADEYRDPAEFFQHTFLTESIKKLVVSSIKRISSMDGSPVVLLESGYGGGKTHSLLTLYHLFSGINASELSGVQPLMKQADVYSLPMVKRAVLVGNKLSPSNPDVKPNGLTISTLWGELAYQLGGKKAFEKIRNHDKKGTSPGEKKLKDMLSSVGPCLILVDEWVTYARQLNDQKDLPGGKLEEQVSFARNLVSAVKQSKNCLLVISLPVAASLASSETSNDDAEVGGIHGMEALTYLQNELGDAESSWQPATQEEVLEIVRSRLFEPILPEREKFIKMTAMAFTELYIQKRLEFPAETQTSLYKRRMQAAYPIHPEIFDRLYHDWSSHVRFQRTRGVLRLMATVIHCLWKKKDRNPIILPSTIPVNDQGVLSELTRYQHKNWLEVIRHDVDGPEARSLEVDAKHSHLGQIDASRRVARTIYIGSSTLPERHQQGLDELRVMLGCVMPGESPAIFHDAIQHLVSESTYLSQVDSQLWYTTCPSVTRLGTEREKALADDLKQDNSELVASEVKKQLLERVGTHPDFAGIHLNSDDGASIPDDSSCQLVVLPLDQPFNTEKENPAVLAASNILEKSGKTQRKCRNTLVFLAAEHTDTDELNETVFTYLAWNALLLEKDERKLDDDQVQQIAYRQRATAKKISSYFDAAYKWVLVPSRDGPDQPLNWKAIDLEHADSLAEAAALTLRDKMLMLSALDAHSLQVYLDELSLWEDGHLPVQKLFEYMSAFNHLPRVANTDVLLDAIREGVALDTWQEDSFAFAKAYNKESGKFDGLVAGEAIEITKDCTGVLVRCDRAARQLGLTPDVNEAEEVVEVEAEADAKAEAPLSDLSGSETASVEKCKILKNDIIAFNLQKEDLQITSFSQKTTNGKMANDEVSANVVTSTNGITSTSEDEAESTSGNASTNEVTSSSGNGAESTSGKGKQSNRFHQRVTLDREKAGYDAGLITELLIEHLSDRAGVEVTVTLEVSARLPDGLEEDLARIIMECVRPKKTAKMELVGR